MCTAEGRAKATSVYCGLSTIMADREVDFSPPRYAYCAGGKCLCFQCHVVNCYINQMKTGGTISHCLAARNPRITTVAGPQAILLKKRHKWKRKAKDRHSGSSKSHTKKHKK
eukprot:7590055-Ditylum_brightwellii.AAC.1